MIKRMFPGKSYHEMFARTQANGFDIGVNTEIAKNKKETEDIMEMF